METKASQGDEAIADPVLELGAQIRRMQQDWDPMAAPPSNLLKRVIRRFLSTYLKRQANFNWRLTAALSLAEDALRRLGQEKASVGAIDRLAHQMQTLEDENRALRKRLFELNDQFDSFRRVSDGEVMEHRLNRLERALSTSGPAAQPVKPAEGLHASLPDSYGGAIDYFKFEARFRGSREAIRELHRMYLPYVEAQAPVLDIGCGRGEFLELLKNSGIPCMGVDLDFDMADFCRSIGLDVQHDDAFAYLSRQENGSLGAIFLGQVVEHMSPGAVATLLGIGLEKLRPGGILIAETVNPICSTALANFYLDPTHERPVHPELLMFLAESKGFEPVEYLFSTPLGELPATLHARQGQPESGDRYMDYAVIVRRPDSTN